MALPEPDPSPNRNLKIGDYVSVIESRDEWEDLIGVIDDILDADGESVFESHQRAVRIVVMFPVGQKARKQTRLDEVNEYTPFVLYHLKSNNSRQDFPLRNLEWFDPKEL